MQALGYGVASVTFDPANELLRFAKRRKIGFTLLSDPQSQLIRAFDLLNDRYGEGSYAYGVAHPIVIVLDADGVVTHRFSNSNHYQTPGADTVLQALRADPAS